MPPRSKRRRSTTSRASNGSGPRRISVWSAQPAPARATLLIALGHAAIEASFRVRYFTAVDLVETLYRGLADNSVGRVLEGILKADLILIDEIGFAPMDHTGAQLFFRLVSAAYERRSLGVASHSPFEEWGRFLARPLNRCQPARPAAAPQRARRHRGRVVPHERDARGEENLGSQKLKTHPEGWGLLVAKSGD